MSDRDDNTTGFVIAVVLAVVVTRMAEAVQAQQGRPAAAVRVCVGPEDLTL